jgi:Major Facilitator Superfamily
MFGFFYLSMQYIQLVMGYDAIRTAFALTPLIGPMIVLSGLSFWYVPRLGLRLVVFVGLLLVSAGLLCMRVAEIGSPYWDLAWPLLILSTGIGLCTAPTTSAIMTSVPEDKQGVASAVNDTTREIGAALGIALAGSTLATRYPALLSPQLSAFPEEIRRSATRSLGEAIGIADRIGPRGDHLKDLAKTAFLGAMESSVLALAILIAVSAVLIGLWAPGRDGEQLAPVRRFTSKD